MNDPESARVVNKKRPIMSTCTACVMGSSKSKLPLVVSLKKQKTTTKNTTQSTQCIILAHTSLQNNPLLLLSKIQQI